MKDYRLLTEKQLRARVDGDPEAWKAGYVRSRMPSDRKGLIAAFHAQLMLDDEHCAQVNKMAEDIARRTKQRVYVVGTTGGWHLLLFGLDDGSYDDNEDGEYADDQFIGYYDPEWHFVGCS
jgi:hypothetical protein